MKQNNKEWHGLKSLAPRIETSRILSYPGTCESSRKLEKESCPLKCIWNLPRVSDYAFMCHKCSVCVIQNRFVSQLAFSPGLTNLTSENSSLQEVEQYDTAAWLFSTVVCFSVENFTLRSASQVRTAYDVKNKHMIRCNYLVWYLCYKDAQM